MKIIKENIIKESLRQRGYTEALDFLIFDRETSTSDIARKLVMEGRIPSDMVVISDEQTKGRGRFSRSFFSAKGQGIYMTMILTEKDILFNKRVGNYITPTIGVCIVESIKEELGLDTDIKWVNDILFQGKKVGGILTELVENKNKVKYFLIGIGLNCYKYDLPKELQDIATTLNMDPSITREVLIGSILSKVLCELKNPRADTMDRYREYSCVIGKRVDVMDILGNIKYENALVRDITNKGELIVEADNLHILNSGEISIKI